MNWVSRPSIARRSPEPHPPCLTIPHEDPYPAVARKKVTAAFDGGRLSSDSGVMLVSLAERRCGIAKALAALIADPRNLAHVTHTVEDVLQARIFAIACAYPDGNDLNWLRSDTAFKLACGRLPETGADLCSQPTIRAGRTRPRCGRSSASLTR